SWFRFRLLLWVARRSCSLAVRLRQRNFDDWNIVIIHYRRRIGTHPGFVAVKVEIAVCRAAAQAATLNLADERAPSRFGVKFLQFVENLPKLETAAVMLFQKLDELLPERFNTFRFGVCGHRIVIRRRSGSRSQYAFRHTESCFLDNIFQLSWRTKRICHLVRQRSRKLLIGSFSKTSFAHLQLAPTVSWFMWLMLVLISGCRRGWPEVNLEAVSGYRRQSHLTNFA